MAKPTSDCNYNQVKVTLEVECTFSMQKNHPLILLFDTLPKGEQQKILRGTAVDSMNSLLIKLNNNGSFAFLRSIK